MKPGDRVYRWVWTGGDTYGLVEVVVVRVNRSTVTVQYDDGHCIRVNPNEIAGPATD